MDGVKGPPSTSAVSGFKFRTTNVDGYTIDKTDDSKRITLQVNLPFSGQGQFMEVTSNDPSINQASTLTFRVQI